VSIESEEGEEQEKREDEEKVRLSIQHDRNETSHSSVMIRNG
jgi:hypothetical protein